MVLVVLLVLVVVVLLLLLLAEAYDFGGGGRNDGEEARGRFFFHEVSPATCSIHWSLACSTQVSCDLGNILSVPLSTRTSSNGHLVVISI